MLRPGTVISGSGEGEAFKSFGYILLSGGGPEVQRSSWGHVSTAQRKHRRVEALEKTDEGNLAEALPAADGLDAEILRLLIPATLAVFLDPAMALIDTGMHSSSLWAILSRSRIFLLS